MPNWITFRLFRLPALVLIALLSVTASAQSWRTEPMTPVDQQYLSDQRDSIDNLARSHLGRQINGDKANDLHVIQMLLDRKVVQGSQVRELQAMGLILGTLLKAEKGLNWTIYTDRYGRSRALKLPGIDEFIFPATQISRRAEVGITVDVAAVYRELQQAVIDIRNKPPF